MNIVNKFTKSIIINTIIITPHFSNFTGNRGTGLSGILFVHFDVL